MKTTFVVHSLHRLTTPLLALSIVVLSACSSGPVQRAPIENRAESSGTPTAQAQATQSYTSSVGTKAPSGPFAAHAGQAGYYTVKPGDTLLQIGRNTGQNTRDLIAWNNIANPNQIEVGQVLRVTPPGYPSSGAGASGVISTPITSGAGTANTLPSPAPVGASTTPVAPATTAPVTPPASMVKPADSVDFIWPTNGAVLAGFDEAKNKGIKIAGRAGDPVVAAADGRVVYAGSGLRGYGNLVIIKHNDTYLTAYAHNQKLLVNEEQTVRKGQRIADMGSSDAERVMLHFEVRRNGKPVDPAKYLPTR